MIRRLPIPEAVPGVPSNWPDLLLSSSEMVTDAFGASRLHMMVADGEMLFQLWGNDARRLKWTPIELFGVHPIAPAARFDAMGLIPLMRGSTIRELTPDAALIASPSGGRLTFRRDPQPHAVLIWELGHSTEALLEIRHVS